MSDKRVYCSYYKMANIRKFKSKREKDIANVQPYIVKKIQNNGLSGYSFYFYLLPFNDASSEKTSIIQELLSGGGI